MSADVLREAAALMRSRAQTARAGRWSANREHISAEWSDGPRAVALCGGSILEGNLANAEHIASWHPAVALLVADWLDSTARFLARGELARSRDLHAIRVARAYLGSAPP